MTTFNELGLAEPLTRALADEQYVTPTPIQQQTIPVLMAGKDIIGIAQTGTGKTAAFALPILHKFAGQRIAHEPKTCRVLVLSPTRELSGQIVESFKTYGKHLRLRIALAIGGVSIGGQARTLHGGVDILVATPGRLLDLVQQNALRLKNVDTFVLDEADRMLDMGFIRDIRKIVAKLPAQRQTMLFSATMPQDIAELARQILKDPARVEVTPVSSTAERIAQRVILIDRGAKQAQLAELLRTEKGIDRVLVFSRTKHGADKVARGLTRDGLPAEAIHGNKSQNNRIRVLNAFRSGEMKILVATDIAARGIDVDGVTHVINFDLPNEPESYVHRIGRTARAGAEGVAISLCSPDEKPFLRQIERLTRQTIPSTRSEIVGQPVNPRQLSGAERRHAEQDNRNRGQHRRNKRPSGGPGQRPASAHVQHRDHEQRPRQEQTPRERQEHRQPRHSERAPQRHGKRPHRHERHENQAGTGNAPAPRPIASVQFLQQPK